MSVFGRGRQSTLPTEGRVPGFDGAIGWVNSRPLPAGALHGKVVLVDFWTFTCINWLRTEPHVRAWSRAYRDDGLVVVGVHTPEFSFEHDLGRVQKATEERGIDYPVAIDNDYAVWQAFDNHYWPALYVADQDGVIRFHHFGEGRYEESERVIQRLLGLERELIAVEGAGVEAEADWNNLHAPETYLGHLRGERKGSLERLQPNTWGLAGEWTTTAENVVLDRAGGSIAFRFHARDVHLVLARNGGEPIPFHVLLDGRAPDRAHGEDVDEDGRGILDDSRLYQLIRQREEIRERTVEITFEEPGAEAYVFTFG
jgi:thiol-disulfide isomerase/thioredoxin